MKIKMDLIKKINADYVWKKVNLAGWIVHIRFSGKIGFVEFRDGTGYIQCIAEEKNIWEEKFNELKNCGIESSIKIFGTVSKHPKKDEYEIQTEDFEVISLAKDYPLGQKDHWVEFLFDNRHLYLRSKSQWAIQRVRDEVIHATYDWMQENDFTKIDSPIFTSTCAEDSTSLYETTHTNWETMYLNQTGQMYIEAAIAAHRNVYDFWPVFRAERSKTRRHLNELWMMDAEEAFTDNEWNMKYQEDLIYYIVQRVLKNKRAELEIIGRDISKLEKIQKPFIRKTHAEVVKELQAMWSDIKEWDDLWADDETLLMNKSILYAWRSKTSWYSKMCRSFSSRVIWRNYLMIREDWRLWNIEKENFGSLIQIGRLRMVLGYQKIWMSYDIWIRLWIGEISNVDLWITTHTWSYTIPKISQ